MSHRHPPIGLALYVTEDDVFDWCWQTWYFPWDITLPASPSFRKMLKNSIDFVLLDPFWHHIHQVGHDRGSQFQIEV